LLGGIRGRRGASRIITLHFNLPQHVQHLTHVVTSCRQAASLLFKPAAAPLAATPSDPPPAARRCPPAGRLCLLLLPRPREPPGPVGPVLRPRLPRPPAVPPRPLPARAPGAPPG